MSSLFLSDLSFSLVLLSHLIILVQYLGLFGNLERTLQFENQQNNCLTFTPDNNNLVEGNLEFIIWLNSSDPAVAGLSKSTLIVIDNDRKLIKS